MPDISFNISKGKAAYLAGLTLGANDALIITPIETSGIVSDATMRDYDDLGALLGGASNEQTTMGRKTAASVTVTVDDTNDWVMIDMADPTWTAAGGNPISALAVCYDPDTTGGTDADQIPIALLACVVTPAGGDITYQVASGGFYKAA